MDKKTPNKRKSSGNTNTTPTKLQKITGTPVSQKKNKSPKSPNKNQKTPQKKQLNGKQNTPKQKKKPEPEPVEEDETELMESDENETNDSIEQAENDANENSDNSDADDASDDEENKDESDNEENEDESDGDDKVKVVKGKSAKTADVPFEDRKFGVYVAGFDYKFKDEDIRKLFKNTNILSVFILKDKFTRKSKGSGFVNFKDEASLKKALLKNGTTVGDRTLKVDVPRPQNKKKHIKINKLKPNVKQLKQKPSGAGKQKSPLVKPTNIANKKKGKFNKKAIKQE